MSRIRDFLATHPFTILGTAIGVLFALFILVKVNRTDHEVQKIRDRVVVIERNIKNGKRQPGNRFVCRTNKPHSPGCRELHILLKRLPAKQRHKIQHGIRHLGHTTPTRRPQKPIARRPGTQPPASSPPSSGGGQPGGGGSSSDGPSDTGAQVQVQTSPARIEVRTPAATVQTPVATVQVPPTDIVVQPPLP